MTIKEVSKMYNLSPDTLRFYEKKGLIGPVKKTSGGIRDYEEDDLKRIEFIKCMRSAEIPVIVLKEYVDLFSAGDETIKERRELLEEQKHILEDKIAKIQEAYEKLNKKIDMYYSGELEKYLK